MNINSDSNSNTSININSDTGFNSNVDSNTNIEINSIADSDSNIDSNTGMNNNTNFIANDIFFFNIIYKNISFFFNNPENLPTIPSQKIFFYENKNNPWKSFIKNSRFNTNYF